MGKTNSDLSDLWKSGKGYILSLDWKSEGVTNGERGENEDVQLTCMSENRWIRIGWVSRQKVEISYHIADKIVYELPVTTNS